MPDLVATYRVQLNKEFTLTDLERVIPYLRLLGVKTIYASPIFQAAPGSTHGYDGINPTIINPEIGKEEELIRISEKLKRYGMKWLQDIVPNHMAYCSDNTFLMDVLEKGNLSAYISVFDATLSDNFYSGKIMAPFLGGSLDEAIKRNELKIAFEQNGLGFKYYDSYYPLHPSSYKTILQLCEEVMPDTIKQLIAQIPVSEDKQVFATQWHEFKLQLAATHDKTGYLDKCLELANASHTLLQQIAEEQNYILCNWQEADKQINYRRFFTINGLICLNVQNSGVFDLVHQKTIEYVQKGIFHGLRIDHIDGLHDPTRYLAKLRDKVGEETYITVEKILQHNEGLSAHWPVQGTTGYDFLAIVNNIFSNKKNEEKFTKLYDTLLNAETDVGQQLLDKKAYILEEHMAGELDNLMRLFIHLDLAEKELQAMLQVDLKNAIGKFLVHCPVYRYYGNSFPLVNDEADAIGKIFKHILKKHPELEDAVTILSDALLEKPRSTDDDYNKKVTQFYQRCMQFTGPLMAKGVEDTLMYSYNKFIGHNDVGDTPESFGISVEKFHEVMQERQDHWPATLNTTSTHDTKRGADARARLNVLTDIPGEWATVIKKWQKLNKNLKRSGFPDDNDEYFIYQSLVGSYPMPSADTSDFPSRFKGYLQKAFREAKVHTNWTAPNKKYEEAVAAFADGLLNENKPFWKNFLKFQQRIIDFGIVNSLAQALIKYTSPGIPDTYQGTELWDLSFVDPDNRRAVNYEERQQWLNEMQNDNKLSTTKLWESRYSGKIKLWLVRSLLQLLLQTPDIFTKGQYIPLHVKGKYKDNILAFARRYRQEWYIVAIPLHLADISNKNENSIQFDWKDTHIALPANAPGDWEHLLQNTDGKTEKNIFIKDIFRDIPLALLKLKEAKNERGAGILLHLSSLPSHYGIGDMGDEARHFADFLNRGNQKYWQLLPLNLITEESGYSPYSSISSMAGNTLLISPDILATRGLLDKEELRQNHLPSKNEAAYREAETNKEFLFEKAYQRFLTDNFSKSAFNTFCTQQAYWLDDFALFVALRKENFDRPWYDWPSHYKKREQTALTEFIGQNSYVINKIKWLQYIFAGQWSELKTYCNSSGIQLIGDIPFYVSYDSVDVWAHPDLFSLDESGKLTGLAGVPPDYYSKNGQLWGMPTFNWNALKQQNYKWWIERLKKNLEFFDIVRLDHFRAFAEYWQVPAGEETAQNGTWLPGPGLEFFTKLKQELGSLPFIAEDLGDKMDPVYKLRDEVGLPGMKVLQFAFGGYDPESVDAPHNYKTNCVVYTGTHDNNTTHGWYREDISKKDRKHLEEYTGVKIKEKNVHEVLIRMAYASTSKIAIVPMQDILALDEKSRMNKPGSTDNNWLWRLDPDQLKGYSEKQLAHWTVLYNRF
jgi:malto-oligosyltrehalose synthase/4-alpha-glucanotransferase